MATVVGVRELRQSLSKYLERVAQGESFAVTFHGREVARLTPSGPGDQPLARLAAERGATLPTANLLDSRAMPLPRGAGPMASLLDAEREERS